MDVASPTHPPHSRLPIQHPEYRYPISWNPYFKKVRELGGYCYSDQDTETSPGRWRERFQDTAIVSAPEQRRELHLEIGCNGGHVILEWAARNPQGAYIGLDWKFKQIHRGAEKALKRELGNLTFFRSHAERIHYAFAPGELDHVYLFFPDPWSKHSQQKNRFFTESNLRMVATLVRPGGTFTVKTDHVEYFEWMKNHASRVADLWQITQQTDDLHQGHPEPETLQIPDVTLFERIFIRQKTPIHYMKLVRL